MTITTSTSSRETPAAAYSGAVLALRGVGKSLGAAVDIRYEAPPGFRAVPNRDGILNPTLDLVTDPRRLALVAAIDRAHAALLRLTVELTAATTDLDAALARWEGETP